MTPDRLGFACSSGLTLPPEGPIALVGAPRDAAMPDMDDPTRCVVIQTQYPDHMGWQARGVTVQTELTGPYAAVVVTLPRARDLATGWVAQAAAALGPDGLLVVDGAKTDGIETMIKALKRAVTIDGQVSKAHGKLVWCRPGTALSDWPLLEMTQTTDGDFVAPGVFSADGPDPASQALAAALPKSLKGRIADLGAGWGWLSREVLRRESVTALDMIEANKTALECAIRNVTDNRASGHWADALSWTPSKPLDGVVMNPPFHSGRKAEPALGQGFIRSAARILAPHGQLWMVANRHLPYEQDLNDCFRSVNELGGDSRFKILHAARPTRRRS